MTKYNTMIDNMIAWAKELSALTGDHPKYIGWVPVSRVLAQKENDA